MNIISFGNKVNIVCIVSSYQFTHFLSSGGQLYSKGMNSHHELGLGIDTKCIS